MKIIFLYWQYPFSPLTQPYSLITGVHLLNNLAHIFSIKMFKMSFFYFATYKHTRL